MATVNKPAVNKSAAKDAKAAKPANPKDEGKVQKLDKDGKPVFNEDGTPKMVKPKAPRVKYDGGKRDQAGLLTEIPSDYDAKKHLPPSAKDFANLAVFYDWKAGQAEARAKQLREMAQDERTGGGKAARAEKKRLIKLNEQIADLRKSLEAKLGKEGLEKLIAEAATQA